MNFLFEIQKKKNKNQLPKKQVSMDIRVPARANDSAYAFRPLLKTQNPTSGYAPRPLGMDARKRAYGTLAKIQYAETLVKTSAGQSKKRASVWGNAFSASASFREALGEYIGNIHFSLPRFTPNKLIYGSIMSGVAFGMVSLGLIEKTFDSHANAGEEPAPKVETLNLETGNYNPEKDVFMQYFSDAADAEYQENVRNLVKGHPIEEMLPYIFEKDRVTAAFLIGIAKKESNWGKRRPVLEGQDCFNYWGYRGQRRLMGSGGHTCFNSRKDAVDTVAKRLETLINSERLNTPAKLIVWKCGMSCEGHGRESVEKWIADVDAYYSEMMALESENTELEDVEEGS